ncbi:S1C family serine protease [Halalkalibacterium halodurans]|uniref:S1C family serine protease n=1 Tax=Halalkalibacterium halodurans TaxID=86665 RepID=UPI002E1AADEF|nr:trypsin-like peptidase domain-containing protein [Halalkalibacterium halodurans]
MKVSLYDGQVVTAELIGTDTLTDIAVLKIEGNYSVQSLEFGDSGLLRAGDPVIAIGNPLGLDLSGTVTQGIVSAVDRTISVSTSAGDWDLDVIQTDAAINPGNSGGALINSSGQVIGINSLKISVSGVEGLGFAIPSNDVVEIVDELITNGQVERPYLGGGLASLSDLSRLYLENNVIAVEEGAFVLSVEQSSAAGLAGIQPEDIITSIDGNSIKDDDELRKYLYTELSIGNNITLEFYRGSNLHSVNLTLTSNKQINQ